METEVLRWFQLVADGTRVTEVAKVYQVSQPQVSRALAALQREVGAPLLGRSGRVLRLTHAGSVFKAHVDRFLAGLDDGLAAVDQLVDPERGTVVVAYEPSLGTWLVPLVVGGFRQRHPKIGFVLRQVDEGTPGTELFGAVDTRVDVVVSTSRPRGIPMQWARLFTEELFVAVPGGHPLADRESVRLAELAGEDFVALPRQAPLGGLVAQVLEAATGEPRVSVLAEDLPTVRALVSAGLGVAIVPATGEPLRSVRLLRIEDPGATREVGLGWPADRRLLPSAELFRRFCLAEAGAATRRSPPGARGQARRG